MAADVVRLHVPEAPRCSFCGADHSELGVLCAKCRKGAEPAAQAFLQSTAASVIRDLRLWEQQGFPLAGPIGRALENAQKLYDATEPRITVPVEPEITELEGEFWFHSQRPGDEGFSIGPFPTRELARYDALDHAAGKLRCGKCQRALHYEAESREWRCLEPLDCPRATPVIAVSFDTYT